MWGHGPWGTPSRGHRGARTAAGLPWRSRARGTPRSQQHPRSRQPIPSLHGAAHAWPSAPPRGTRVCARTRAGGPSLTFAGVEAPRPPPVLGVVVDKHVVGHGQDVPVHVHRGRHHHLRGAWGHITPWRGTPRHRHGCPPDAPPTRQCFGVTRVCNCTCVFTRARGLQPRVTGAGDPRGPPQPTPTPPPCPPHPPPPSLAALPEPSGSMQIGWVVNHGEMSQLSYR